MKYPSVRYLLDLLHTDSQRIELGRLRQEAVWRQKIPDKVPIVLGRSESRQDPGRFGPQYLRHCEHQLRGGPKVAEYYEFDHHTLREQFHDPMKMLTESLWDAVGWARTQSDAQLALRPNFGVGTTASVFGCGTDMGENDMPWVTERPGKDELLDIDLDQVDASGLIPRVIEFVRLARDVLEPYPDVHIYMPDFQGPMNTAFLLRQQQVFLDMIDDEPYYRRLMDLICEVFIRLTRRLKQEIGEPLESGYHGAMYMGAGGARVVDDVSIMLSPPQYELFSLAYVRKCLAPFGGGWVHSCGDVNHQLRFYLEAPEIRGVNFGEPEYYDFPSLLPRFAETGTFCYGGPVREPGESVEDYLDRVARCVREQPSSLIFQPRMRGQEMSEGHWPAPEVILDRWYALSGAA